jgi:hypothetical protein
MQFNNFAVHVETPAEMCRSSFPSTDNHDLHRPSASKHSKNMAVQNHLLVKHYSCSLCAEYSPTTKRNNVEQHVWAHHSHVHGGNSQNLRYRAKEHKELVSPYVVVTQPSPCPEPDDAASPAAKLPTLRVNTPQALSEFNFSNDATSYSASGSSYQQSFGTSGILSTASCSSSNGSTSGDSIAYQHHLAVPMLSSRATTGNGHHQHHRGDASGFSGASRHYSADSACDLHFSRSLGKRCRLQRLMTYSAPFYQRHSPDLLDTENVAKSLKATPLLTTPADLLWRPYLL